MAGQMEEIDRPLKRIDQHLESIEFTLTPKNAPSIAGVIFGNADRLNRIEERLQRIEIAAAIFADVDKLEKIAERLHKIEEKLGISN
jgi:tetrahydromethanopterin S-methyltransferase subunit G